MAKRKRRRKANPLLQLCVENQRLLAAYARAWAENQRLLAAYARAIDQALDDGPDKTYILRKIHETAMWINVALTRDADGSPR